MDQKCQETMEEKREEGALPLMERLSKILMPVCSCPGARGRVGAGEAVGHMPRDSPPCSMAFYTQLATVTTYFWWHRKRTDLLWFGSNTVTQVILK